MAKRGYRPVPLYNSCPAPADWRQAAQSAESPTAIPSTVVDVRPVMDALWKGAEVLQQLVISADAPAAFLLDANRRGGGVEPKEGDFDNRAISFPTDFPSANFLLAHSIRRILLVQRMGLQPQPDLAHTLRRWQEAGIQVYGKSLDSSESPALINVERPSRFGLVWYRFLALIGFRRNLLGGFGGVVPDSSAG
ncbi:MAG: hypothetical protein HY360_14190 [Verrucomicrobia bacterium]|nr:hypothetical protein [Verrucomicrobiota bacterium]